MKKSLINLAVAGVFGFVASAAVAEDAYQGAWYAVPGVTVTSPDNDLKTEDTGLGGFLRIGKELSEHWDVQVGASQTRTDDDLAGVDGKYKQTLLGVDALYVFSRDKFQPFLLAGLGAARNKVQYNIPGYDGQNTSWMANVGLGAKYLISENFGLQADLRQVWSRADLNTPVLGTGKETVSNTLLNLGAIFRFGAPKPVVAPEPTPEPTPVAAVEPAPVPAPAPVVAPEPCKPKFETITVQAEKLFGFDKSALKDEGKAALDSAAEKIIANPDIDLVLVTGHTDLLGSDAYNQKLSERRANQVKSYLVSKGVPAAKLHAVGKGESEPVVTCDGVKGRKKLIECLQPNRRVVLTAEKVRETGCQ